MTIGGSVPGYNPDTDNIRFNYEDGVTKKTYEINISNIKNIVRLKADERTALVNNIFQNAKEFQPGAKFKGALKIDENSRDIKSESLLNTILGNRKRNPDTTIEIKDLSAEPMPKEALMQEQPQKPKEKSNIPPPPTPPRPTVFSGANPVPPPPVPPRPTMPSKPVATKGGQPLGPPPIKPPPRPASSSEKGSHLASPPTRPVPRPPPAQIPGPSKLKKIWPPTDQK